MECIDFVPGFCYLPSLRTTRLAALLVVQHVLASRFRGVAACSAMQAAMIMLLLCSLCGVHVAWAAFNSSQTAFGIPPPSGTDAIVVFPGGCCHTAQVWAGA